jgi:hypothetical protein
MQEKVHEELVEAREEAVEQFLEDMIAEREDMILTDIRRGLEF